MWQVIVPCFLLMIAGLLGLFAALKVAQSLTRRPVTLSKLTIDLWPKLWMTAGLGIFFFGFYVLAVMICGYWIDAEMRQRLFNLALRHPTKFIYAGMGLFASISLGVLVIRSAIKRLYNFSKNKR